MESKTPRVRGFRRHIRSPPIVRAQQPFQGIPTPRLFRPEIPMTFCHLQIYTGLQAQQRGLTDSLNRRAPQFGPSRWMAHGLFYYFKNFTVRDWGFGNFLPGARSCVGIHSNIRVHYGGFTASKFICKNRNYIKLYAAKIKMNFALRPSLRIMKNTIFF